MSEESEEGEREEYCSRISAISFAGRGGGKIKELERGFGSQSSDPRTHGLS